MRNNKIIFYEIRTKRYVTDIWDEFSEYVLSNRKAFHSYPGYYVKFFLTKFLFNFSFINRF